MRYIEKYCTWYFFDLCNMTIIVELWTFYITINAKKDVHRHTTPDKNTLLRATLNIFVPIIFRLKNLNKRIHHLKCNIQVQNNTSTHWIQKSRHRVRQPQVFEHLKTSHSSRTDTSVAIMLSFHLMHWQISHHQGLSSFYVGLGPRLSTSLIAPVKSAVTMTCLGVSSISLLGSDSCLLERTNREGLGANTTAVTVALWTKIKKLGH